MMDQLPFPTTRQNDPETSHLAARDAARTANTVREQCYLALCEAGEDGLTDFELAEIVGRQQTSAGKRRGELVDDGLVVPTTQRRKAPSGSLAIVWRVAVDVATVTVAGERL